MENPELAKKLGEWSYMSVIRQGDGTTGSPGGRDHLFGSG
jgi:hypothetical protein